MRLPRLRSLDAFPIQDNGRTFLALRDGEGFSSKLLLLSAADAAIATRLDGEHTAEEIAADLARHDPKQFPVKRIRDVVRVLDDNMMLESEKFLAHKAKVVADFRAAPARPAFLAGQSYPADAGALSRKLDEILSLAPEPEGRENCGPLTGLVAPHIDFERGKQGYAHAYGEALRCGMADLYVILGVAHAGAPTPLVLAEKDFQTPLGPAPVDRDLARAVAKAAPYDMLADEFVHRMEHSIEFQAVFLAHIARRSGASFKILPLLCSTCDIDEGGMARTSSALAALARLLKSYRGRVCLLAAADLAHVGPRFGDDEQPTPAVLQEVAAQDRKTIERLLEMDPDGVLRSIMADGNRRKVCGTAALHAFATLHRALAPDACGELLHYSHAADPAGGEVSFASMAFYRPAKA